VTYSDFAARWQKSGGAERANYGLLPLLATLAALSLLRQTPEGAYAN
jgi:hypothetical protein